MNCQMPSRPADTVPMLDLPPGYTLVPLREHGDAFVHGCAIASDSGAGALVWVRRYDLVEFAVVLEPDEPLLSARRAFFAGMNAAADAIAAHCPPERRRIDLSGDLLITPPTGSGPPERASLVDALAKAAWYDPQARGPKLG